MDSNIDKKNTNTGLWITALILVAVVCFALCGGVAFSSIRQAELSAAKANLGQIEAVLLLAERYAEDNGYGPAPATYENVLRSYDDTTSIAKLTPQEKYVLDAMLEMFGQSRDFDFAITRITDGAGIQTQIYYFPVKGKTDARIDRHYLQIGDTIAEKNG